MGTDPSEEQIRKRVGELAAEINRDYAGRDLLLLCILRGAFVFLSDLVRRLEIPCSLDFMAVASYAPGARETTGMVRIGYDPATELSGRDVVVVEDIIDSGHTLASVLELLRARHPRSLEVCVLLDKVERRVIPIPVRYRGFAIPDRFVFGYGLDMDEKYRNLPYLAALKTPDPAGPNPGGPQ